MKKQLHIILIPVLIVVVVLLILSFSACQKNSDIQPADLSHVAIGGFYIGDNILEIDTSDLTVSDRYESSTGSYNFEECRIETEDNIITRITGEFGDIEVRINGQNEFSTCSDVIAVLGENDSTSWYDREQGLKQIQYADTSVGIMCTIVYNNNSNHLVWIILERQ